LLFDSLEVPPLLRKSGRIIMKTIRGFKARGFILAAAFSAGLGFGTSASAQVRSYLIDLNSKTATVIGTLGGTFTSAQGINGAGQVTGGSFTDGNAERHAFITGPNGMGMRDLGTFGGGYSEGHAINDAGQVAGFSYTAGVLEPVGFKLAFITGPDGMGMSSLDALGGVGGFSSGAAGINDAGQVVGTSSTNEGSRHAFITGPDGMGMRDLGTLGGFGSSGAVGINDAGQVVGWSYTAGGAQHAFITGPDGAGVMDLSSLVDLPGGVILTEARGINNTGQVIAIAIVPEPEIYALFLAGLCPVGFMARRKKTG
jgi:probable HAF family extracellular repeat protein